LERRSEHDAPPDKPCLHSRNARFEASSSFSRTELLEITKDEDLTILCRKSRYSAANRLCYFRASETLVRRFSARRKAVEIAEWLTQSPTLLPAI
jgi:hypothetical protein